MSQKVEWLVLVDDNDRELGTETRENCHKGKGLRHRAFVVFLLKDGKILLQRRSMKKQLWPGYWDVSFTSHVYRGETYEQAGERRARQELNTEVKGLKRVLAFTYTAKFGDYSENEYCALLIGKEQASVNPNPDEVMEIKYRTPSQLAKEISEDPEVYTPWLKIALERYLKLPG
jgi:isopentenyl-diphosphate Delta-isomerase